MHIVKHNTTLKNYSITYPFPFLPSDVHAAPNLRPLLAR